VVIQFGATRYEIKLIGGEGNLDQVPPEVKRLSPGEFLIALKDEGGARHINLPFVAVEPTS
jgi:hypothetical protein